MLPRVLLLMLLRVSPRPSIVQALHKAAFWGHDHICAYLIKEHDADVTALDCEGENAFHDAARSFPMPLAFLPSVFRIICFVAA